MLHVRDGAEWIRRTCARLNCPRAQAAAYSRKNKKTRKASEGDKQAQRVQQGRNAEPRGGTALPELITSWDPAGSRGTSFPDLVAEAGLGGVPHLMCTLAPRDGADTRFLSNYKSGIVSSARRPKRHGINLTLAEIAPESAIIATSRPRHFRSGHHRPKLAEIAQDLANINRIRPTSLGQNRPSLARVAPESVNVAQ